MSAGCVDDAFLHGVRIEAWQQRRRCRDAGVMDGRLRTGDECGPGVIVFSCSGQYNIIYKAQPLGLRKYARMPELLMP
jgi:hypothetical protein